MFMNFLFWRETSLFKCLFQANHNIRTCSVLREFKNHMASFRCSKTSTWRLQKGRSWPLSEHQEQAKVHCCTYSARSIRQTQAGSTFTIKTCLDKAQKTWRHFA